MFCCAAYPEHDINGQTIPIKAKEKPGNTAIKNLCATGIREEMKAELGSSLPPGDKHVSPTPNILETSITYAVQGSQCVYTNVERHGRMGEKRTRPDLSVEDRLPPILRSACRRSAC